MSRKLRDFIPLISLDHTRRDELEIGTFVSWLRRRVGILKDAETKTVIEIIRHCKYTKVAKNELVFQQGEKKNGQSKSDFYIVLRGSVSVIVNPFLAQGPLRRGSNNSLELALQSASLQNRNVSTAKSVSSKRTAFSQYAPLAEHPDSDVTDSEESDTMMHQENAESSSNTDNNQSDAPTQNTHGTERSGKAPPPSPKSRSPRRSVQETPRSKLGNFVVKYEKGTCFDEDSLLDTNGIYAASIITVDDTDIMILPYNIYDQYIKEHHDKETMTMSNFVDLHPFFRHLPPHARGVLQISLKKQHIPAGSYIVKQGEPVNKLMFIISGSAELIIEPGKHRNQYPELWPFETSTDVYFNECEWLRESRRRVYERKYEHTGEVSRRSQHKELKKTWRPEVVVCSVQQREVIGIAEIVLDLPTHMNSLKCTQDCEIYTLGLKPFRLIKKKHPEVMEMVRAHVRTKLHFRLQNGVGEQVPLIQSLYNKLETNSKTKHNTEHTIKKPEHYRGHREDDKMMRLVNYFKMNKAPLVKELDPRVVDLREEMKEKARIRESVRNRSIVIGGSKKGFHRRGCLAKVMHGRQPRSLYALRDPMSELIVRLRMEGTVVTEEDLEELLIRYSVTPVMDDISVQSQRVIDEEYKLLRYRRYGNRLVRNFMKMIDRRDARYLLGSRAKTILSTTQHGDQLDIEEEDDPDFPLYWPDVIPDHDDTGRIKTRPTTFKSTATTDTYKTLQFERRGLTPRTLDMRIKDFHVKFGGEHLQVNNLPSMKASHDREFDVDFDPRPGGKVFVTTVPCISCIKNVRLKNHSHIRCQMLHELPMNKVKGYKPY